MTAVSFGGPGTAVLEVRAAHGGPILVFDSATHVRPYFAARGRTADSVIVSCSYAGVYCARLVAPHARAGAIGVDCGIGKDGAGIAGLWFYEALEIAAGAAAIRDVELGNGRDLWESGRLSRVNSYAEALGLAPGMMVKDAAAAMLAAAPDEQVESDCSRRWVVERGEGGDVVCFDSIADAEPEDRDRNVVCVAGHAGRSVIAYFRSFRPRGIICSDGGGGKNQSGLVALWAVDHEIPAATVSATTARMGDGRSTYFDGDITACNRAAQACGVTEGQSAREAAHLMLTRSHTSVRARNEKANEEGVAG